MALKKGALPKPKPSKKRTRPPPVSKSVLPKTKGDLVASTQAQPGFPVVGIGASAGGLSAFKKFFGAMPADSGLAFVLIPHLDPTHESLMVELLSKYSSMPVVEAADGVAVQPDHVYIIPPNKYLTIQGGILQLRGPMERHESPTSIDFFLRSLAEDQQERAIGVILSGTGAYGSLGLKEIKANGGMSMVQDPKTAEYDRMPRSAIATGLVDYVLPVEHMPEALIQFVRHAYIKGSEPAADQVADHLSEILTLLRARSRFDFRCYRKKMLVRRVERRMGLNHIEDSTEYLEILRSKPDELKLLIKDLLISVTSFFRDPEAFQALETQVILDLVRRQAAGNPLRVWIPACATGEEAYSVAMLILEQLENEHKDCSLQVFATDVDEDALAVARQGIYPESITADLSPQRLKRFFTRIEGHSYQVSKQLREVVVFAAQNLILDAPFSRLDLISCRNLLIYLEPEVQQKIIALFHFALTERGYLFLGTSETTGRQSTLFQPVAKKWRLYRRIGPSRPERVDFPIVPGESQHGLTTTRLEPSASTASFADITQQVLLADHAPAAVLINRAGEILYFHGPTMNYLDQPTGEPTRDLFRMAREGLGTKLRATVHQAVRDHKCSVSTESRFRRAGCQHPVRLTVKPVPAASNSEGLWLVVFEDLPQQTASAFSDAHAADDSTLRELEVELSTTRHDLQSTIENLESVNEEFKAANEEVMSMNEELQSANEELETSKEELQSLNEELTTVNSQLQDKVEELESVNNDIANLFNSADFATIFLGADLLIRRFTPAATKLFNLIAADVGRPISDIAPKFMDDSLCSDISKVLDSLATLEKEVPVKEGERWYLRRILPYRTIDNRIDGVVITFADVTQLKKAELLLRQNRELKRLATVLLDSNDAVTVLDFEGSISSWNRGAERMYGYTEAEALRMNLRDLIPENGRQEEFAYLQRLHSGEKIESWEAQRITRDGRAVDVWLTATTLNNEAGELVAISTTERDITERKLLESNLRESSERIASILNSAADGILTFDQQGIIEIANPATGRLFGYAQSELLGRRISDLISPPYREEMNLALENGGDSETPRIIDMSGEVRCHRKDGSTFPGELVVSEVAGLQCCTGIVRDISQRRELERQVLEVANAEQRRIGQDLHDSAGQELTGLGLMADSLTSTLEEVSSPLAELSVRITDGIKRVLGQVRTLSRGLVPVEVDPGGLDSALHELAARVSDLQGVTCDYKGTATLRIQDNQVATQLYRIAQEAVANALKHGHAQHINMGLNAEGNAFILWIRDDGVGMPDTMPLNSGMGLRIMHYRAGLINAHLTAVKAKEGGTLVACRLNNRASDGQAK